MFCMRFFLNVALSFDNEWTDNNVDHYAMIVDKQITMATNLVNFGPVTPEILMCIRMVSATDLTDCREANVRSVLDSLGGSSIAGL